MKKLIVASALIIGVFLVSFLNLNGTEAAASYGSCVADQSGLTEFNNLSTTDLMARLVYSEARGESMDGKEAVTQVVLNRGFKNLPEFGGQNISDVILHPGSFEGMTTIDARCPKKNLERHLANQGHKLN